MKCDDLWKILQENNLVYFTGVPDSTFAPWMSFLEEKHNQGLINRIAAVERDAIGWAAGYYVASGEIATVYMQNSGLGNTVNPITSLLDQEVYHIPMLFMIGWRGMPGIHDEPQHVKMGKITLPLLDMLGIKYQLLPENIELAKETILEAKKYLEKTKGLYALIIKEKTFAPYKKDKNEEQNVVIKSTMTREKAIQTTIDKLTNADVVVSTTGKASRELYEYRLQKNQGHQRDFLMVGSMGLASSFGAEIALQLPTKRVVILDGDGALIMSAGTLSTIGHYAPKNLYHIVFDNIAYDSTGGQPTVSSTMNMEMLALANNYVGAQTVHNEEQLTQVLDKMLNTSNGPRLLVVKVCNGARQDLGRPKSSPVENKNMFMQFIRGSQNVGEKL